MFYEHIRQQESLEIIECPTQEKEKNPKEIKVRAKTNGIETKED